MMRLLATATVTAVLLVSAGRLSAASQTVEVYRWSFEGSPYGNPSCERPGCDGQIKPIDGPTRYRPFGRVGQALDIRNLDIPFNSGGYHAGAANAVPGKYGFAWMGWVWVNQLPGDGLSVIFWQDGSVRAVVHSNGALAASVGMEDGTWGPDVVGASNRTIGIKAWHHVALIAERPIASASATVHLLLDGSEIARVTQASLPTCSVGQVGFGAYYNGKGRDLLDGALDEVAVEQLVTPYAPGNSFVMYEHGLRLRQAVLADLARYVPEYADSELFSSPTVQGTSILRAWVNSFFTNAHAGKPQDPLGPLSSGMAQYVMPDSMPVYVGTGDVCDGSEKGRCNSLYLNLKFGYVSGICGAASLTLWAVYKAFGYSTRRYDSVSGPDFGYQTSHATTDVFVTARTSAQGSPPINKYIIQDATYNIVGLSTSRPGSYYGVWDLPAAPPGLVFADGDCDGKGGRCVLNTDRIADWGYNVPQGVAPADYLRWFQGIVSVAASWTY